MSDLTHAQIGRAFVKQYYTTLHENPGELCKLYNASSTLVHGGNDCTGEGDVVYGAEQIATKLKQLDFHECRTRIIQFDSARTLDNGIVLQVCGEISNRGAPMRRFTQTFVLCPIEARKFYVANDIFRYQDEVFGHSTPSTRRAMIDTAQFARHRSNTQRQEAFQRIPVTPTQPQQAWAGNNANSTFGDCRLQDGLFCDDNLSETGAALPSDLKNNWATFNSVSTPYDQSSFPAMSTSARDSNSVFNADYARQFQVYATLDEHFPLETIEVNCSRSTVAPTTSIGNNNHRNPHQMVNFNSVYSPDAHRNQLGPSNTSPFACHNAKRYDLSPDEVDKVRSPSTRSPHSAASDSSPPAGGEQPSDNAPSRSWAAIASCGQASQPSVTVRTSPDTPAAARSRAAAQVSANNVSTAPTSPSSAASLYNAQGAVSTTPTRSSRSSTAGQTTGGRQANTGQRYPEDHQVFVGNVSNSVDEETLRQLMTHYGNVLEVRLAEKNIADKPKFAFVVFDSAATADKLIADAAQNPVRLHGKRLNIERRNPTNRSSGGNSVTTARTANSAANAVGRSSRAGASSGANLNRQRAQRATLH